MTVTGDTRPSTDIASVTTTSSNENESDTPVSIVSAKEGTGTPRVADRDESGPSQIVKPQNLGERLVGITTENAPDLALFRNQVVSTLREWYVLASDSIVSLLEGRSLQDPAKDLWLLGKHYEIVDQADEQAWGASGYSPEVLSDFSHLIWCTYRSQYPPIAPSAFTSDAGWGCMLRAGQTLLAQALQLHHFGRDWSFSWDGALGEDVRRRELYTDIVKQFFDDYSSSSTFSIHRMASLGKQFEGKDIGE
ncbi:Cysteine protease atg4, partial [Coemansia sp. S2]